MRHHTSKLENANVVVAFPIQDEAEEALLDLRSVGFRDSQIGYYFSVGKGLMRDTLANYHRVAATVIWGIIGTAAGLALAWGVYLAGFDADWFGLSVTCGTFGFLLVGMLGGMVGLTRPGADSYALAPEGQPPYYIMTVNAGDKRGQVLRMMEQRGGHELEPTGEVQPALVH
jgi:hypothetical protein